GAVLRGLQAMGGSWGRRIRRGRPQRHPQPPLQRACHHQRDRVTTSPPWDAPGEAIVAQRPTSGPVATAPNAAATGSARTLSPKAGATTPHFMHLLPGCATGSRGTLCATAKAV